tara:strand:- start:12 stop:1052 length:1041 start_codon:yes stop_codon:yes gene_type:complete
MTKCPYVPPHEWEIDFPHLMLRGKNIKFNKSKISFRDKILTSTDLLGKIGSRKFVAPVLNFFNSIKLFRVIIEKIFRIHRNAKLPFFVSKTAKSLQAKAPAVSKDKRKVAIFTTCYHNYNEPIIISDLLLILSHNDIDAEIIKDDNCCGMPKLELGDLEEVELKMQRNLTKFKKYIDNDYVILAPIPSCVLMFKQELPLMFQDNKQLIKLSKLISDPFEYLNKLHGERKLKTDFKNKLGDIFYQVACHQRVQNIGQVTKKILELVPETNVDTIERCSGHDGTYGVKLETHEIAMKIVKPITREYEKSAAETFTSDCSLAAHHIENALGNKVAPIHPITLLKNAYGI